MSSSPFAFESICDDLGPSMIAHLHDPASGLRAIVVVDNTACGPSIGGVRMAPDVSTEEVFRLARAMTLKNAAAGLPHGGGKSGIVADPATADKRRLVVAFARAIRTLESYIPGPDMGTDERCMAWIHAEIGRSVGLPRVIGGIPLDEIGATGYGLARCAEVAAPRCGVALDGATVAIEGFGNVGRHAAAFLEALGAVLVAASDSRGAVHAPDGMKAADLAAAKRATGGVGGYDGAESIDRAALLTVPCDILVPAARPDSIHRGNVDAVKARLVLQGANIPATAEAETTLHRRGVMVIPDFIANAGGVICASVEHHGGTERDALDRIADRISRNTAEVMERSENEDVPPRAAAMKIARARVVEAMSYRAP